MLKPEQAGAAHHRRWPRPFRPNGGRRALPPRSSSRSTPPHESAETTQSSTHSYSDCTPRPPAAEAAPWASAPRTSTSTAAWSSAARRNLSNERLWRTFGGAVVALCRGGSTGCHVRSRKALRDHVTRRSSASTRPPRIPVTTERAYRWPAGILTRRRGSQMDQMWMPWHTPSAVASNRLTPNSAPTSTTSRACLGSNWPSTIFMS